MIWQILEWIGIAVGIGAVIFILFVLYVIFSIMWDADHGRNPFQ